MEPDDPTPDGSAFDGSTGSDARDDAAAAHRAQTWNLASIVLCCVAAVALVLVFGAEGAKPVRIAAASFAVLSAALVGITTAWVLVLHAERKHQSKSGRS